MCRPDLACRRCRMCLSLKLVLIALYAILMFHLLGCGHSKATADSQPVPVQLRQPRLIQQPVAVLAGGDVESYTSAMVAFEVSGRVKRVYVEEGQHVTRGQLLAEIDSTDYQHGYDAARGTTDAARATEKKAQNGLRPEELEQARLAMEQTQDEYQRMKFLYDRKSLSAEDFHKFSTDFQTARQNYAMAQKGTRMEDAEAAAITAKCHRQIALRHRQRALCQAPPFRSPIEPTIRKRGINERLSVGLAAIAGDSQSHFGLPAGQRQSLIGRDLVVQLGKGQNFESFNCFHAVAGVGSFNGRRLSRARAISSIAALPASPC